MINRADCLTPRTSDRSEKLAKIASRVAMRVGKLHATHINAGYNEVKISKGSVLNILISCIVYVNMIFVKDNMNIGVRRCTLA